MRDSMRHIAYVLPRAINAPSARAIGAGFLFLVCSIFATPAGAADLTRPNIVLCMADDQGWGDVAYNGHPVLKTPNLDALAAAGLRFDRFYAGACLCSPTRGSVLTGRNAMRYGILNVGYPIRPQETTIAEALKAAGYTTGHFGKWHVGSVLEGSPVNPGASGFDEWLSAPNFYDNDPILSANGKATPLKGEGSMVTVEAALTFMGKAAKLGKPFLTLVWFGSPHAPHIPLPEDAAAYPDEPKDRQNIFGEITAMDRAVGRLRAGLHELNVADNTLLWYCSDNGGLPVSGATGGRGAKASLYEGGIRVPCVIEWPARLKTPTVCATPWTTDDIYPTLLEITGVMPPHQAPLDGESLTAVFEAPDTMRKRPMGFWLCLERFIAMPSAQWMKELYDEQRQGLPPADQSRLCLDAGSLDGRFGRIGMEGQVAWLDWPWKLIRTQREPVAEPIYEMYNLEVDPMEASDFYSRQPKRAETFKGAMEEWQRSVLTSLHEGDYNP